MKKLVVMLLVIGLLAASLGFSPVRAAESVVVQITIGSTKGYVNFKEVALDQGPIIEKGTTLVPFRFIGEALGAKVGWDPAKKTASYVLGNKNIVLTIGSTTATVNGVKSILTVAPKILPSGRTVVPVRFVTEKIGAKVDWNSNTQVVTISVSATPPQSAQTIKIGVALPLTGGSAAAGTQIDNGAKLAVKEINAAGGVNGQMLQLVEMDDRADPKQAATIANLFVGDKDILACIADYNSSCTLAAAPIYNRGHLVHLCFSTAPKVSDAGDYTFRPWNSDTYRASFLVQIMLDAGYKKIGFLYQNDDTGLGALKVAKDLLATVGLKPLVTEGFLLGQTKDFNTVITKMKNAGCDSAYLMGDESEIAAFATQSALQGWKPFLVSQGTYNPQVIKLGGKYVEGMVGYANFDPNKMSDKVKAFFDKYTAAYGGGGNESTVENPFSPSAYDIIRMIVMALENGAKTREDIQKYLANLKDFPGTVATLSFDKNGDMRVPLVAVVIKDGKYVLYTGK